MQLNWCEQDAYIVKVMGSSPVIGTGVYAVEFSLRAECTKHLKEGYKESNRLSSLRREKLALLWRWFNVKTNTRDVSGLDHPFHVNVMKRNPKEQSQIAEVAQLVELLPSKQVVEGSSPFFRSKNKRVKRINDGKYGFIRNFRII